jgi:hypothetical protein
MPMLIPSQRSMGAIAMNIAAALLTCNPHVQCTSALCKNTRLSFTPDTRPICTPFIPLSSFVPLIYTCIWVRSTRGESKKLLDRYRRYFFLIYEPRYVPAGAWGIRLSESYLLHRVNHVPAGCAASRRTLQWLYEHYWVPSAERVRVGMCGHSQVLLNPPTHQQPQL